MKPTILKWFKISYPGIARTLKSKVKLGLLLLINETKHEFKEDFLALWDTGATNSCIKNSIAVRYSLPVCRQLVCRGAYGKKKVNSYLVSLLLPNNDLIHEIELISCDDSILVDMLIGMDIITRGELIINNYNGITAYSFQIPAPTYLSLDTIYAREDIKILINEGDEDKPCPCGGLLPFAKCCKKID